MSQMCKLVDLMNRLKQFGVCIDPEAHLEQFAQLGWFEQIATFARRVSRFEALRRMGAPAIVLQRELMLLTISVLAFENKVVHEAEKSGAFHESQSPSNQVA